MAYCDGHVESLKFEDVFFDETARAYRRWDRDHLTPWDYLKQRYEQTANQGRP